MLNYINNLRMDTSCSSYRENVLEGVKKMRQEGNANSIKVDLILKYQMHAKEFLPERYLGLKNLFVKLYAPGKNPESAENGDVLFDIAVRKFKDYCEAKEISVGIGWLVDRDCWALSAADMLFIRLVRLYGVASQHDARLADWSTEKIAKSVIEYMWDYCISNNPIASYSIEEDFLDCLMHDDSECQQPEKAIPA